MNQLNMTNQQVETIKNRYEQEEQSRLMDEISQAASDTENFPYFEMVREEMAQLLENGKAHNLKTAHDKAMWNVPEVRELEIQKLVSKSSNQMNKQQQVAKAKATAVSPRSVTPNGVGGQTEAKDRRSILEKELSQAMGGRV